MLEDAEHLLVFDYEDRIKKFLEGKIVEFFRENETSTEGR